MSDEARQPFKPDGYGDFVGGVQQWLPPYRSAPNQSEVMRNLNAFNSGTLRMAGGIRSHKVYRDSSAGLLPKESQPRALYGFRIAGNPAFLVGIHDTNDITASEVVIDDGTDSGLIRMASPVQFSDRVQVVKLRSRIYFFEPGYAPLYWEWGNVTLKFEEGGNESIPHGVCAAYFRGRGWVGKDDLLFFSLTLGTDSGTGEVDPRTEFEWDQTFFAFQMQTGRIVQLKPFRNFNLLVFTENGVETMEVDPCNVLDSVRLTISDNIGCGSGNTVVMAGQDVFFMDQEGHLRSLNQTQLDESNGITNVPLSQPISGVVDSQTKHRLFTSKAIHHKGFIVWAFATGGSLYPNEVWVYSIRDKAWEGPFMFHHNPTLGDIEPYQIYGLASHRFFSEDPEMYALMKTTTGESEVFKLFRAGTDDGQAVFYQWISRGFCDGNPLTEKFWNGVQVDYQYLAGRDADTFTVTAEARIDQEKWVVLGSKTIALSAGPQLGQNPTETQLPFQLEPNLRQNFKFTLEDLEKNVGRVLQVRLTWQHSGAGSFEIQGVLVTHQEENLDFSEEH